MVHTFVYNDKTLKVDDDKTFSNQLKSFRNFWNNAPTEQMDGFDSLDIEDITIAVYHLGAVCVMPQNKEEEEEDEDE